MDAMMSRYTLKSEKKRKYHRESTMLKAEVMLIMILFHDSDYRCLKYFYWEKVCNICGIFSQKLFLTIVLLSWKGTLPYHQPYLSRKSCLAHVLA